MSLICEETILIDNSYSGSPSVRSREIQNVNLALKLFYRTKSLLYLQTLTDICTEPHIASSYGDVWCIISHILRTYQFPRPFLAMLDNSMDYDAFINLLFYLNKKKDILNGLLVNNCVLLFLSYQQINELIVKITKFGISNHIYMDINIL